MMFYDLAALKSKADCVEILDWLGCKLNERGRGPAVWRGGDGPNVHADKEQWYDHKMKRGGGAIELVMEAHRCDFNSAVEWLGERLGLTKTIELKNTRKVLKEYIYEDENGNPCHKTIRYEPKDFSQAHYKNDPELGPRWIPGLNGIRLWPYNWPRCKNEQTIYIHEGEKACECAINNGMKPSTTFALGAGNWKEEYCNLFHGKDIVIVADNDDAGKHHADVVAWNLRESAKSIKIVVPSKIDKGDIYEFFEQEKGTLEQFERMLKHAKEIDRELLAKPTKVADSEAEAKAKAKNVSPFTNFKIVETIDEHGNSKDKAIPKTIREMIEDLKIRMMGFPKVVGSDLFDMNKKTNKREVLKDATDLTSWISERTKHNCIFKTGNAFVSSAELFSALLRQDENYIGISDSPHYPPKQGFFYAHPTLPAPDKKHSRFEWFCKFFSPATESDRQLIRMCVATLLFRGNCADMPLWIIDATSGQGTGKTRFCEVMSWLLGSEPMIVPMSMLIKENIHQVYRRALSFEGRSKRVFLIDNIDKHFRSDEFATMVTQSSFSGLAPYGRGETTRPNDFIYFLTCNSGSFSRDIINRSMYLKLKKPTIERPYWARDVKEYIDNNKLQIYSDILDILGSKPNFELKTYKTRFRQWEDYVATRLFKSQEDYEQAFFDVAERHEESDGDKNQCCEIEEFFASKISMLGYDPDKDHLWLQVPLLKAWCSEIDIVSKYNDGHIMHMFRKWIRINMFTHIQESNFQLWPTVRGYVRTKGLFWNYAEYAQKQIKKVPCQVHTLGMEYGKEKVIHSI